MCLAVPSKIISIDDSRATIDVYGAQRDISLMLLEDKVNIGDYVLVHAGFAIQKLQEDIAKETLALFDQYLESDLSLDKPAEQSAGQSSAKSKTKKAKTTTKTTRARKQKKS